MGKASEIEAVTQSDVDQAVQDVANAREALEALKHRFVTGDDSITQPMLNEQSGVVEWLELVAKRVENQRTRYEVEFAKASRQDLRAEILSDATESGAEMLALVDQIVSASNEFAALAKAHNAQLAGWVQRAMSLGVPDKGVISAAHEGLGVEAGGAVLVDDVRVDLVHAAGVLRLLFGDDMQNGLVPLPADDEKPQGVRNLLRRVGRVNV